MNRVRAAALAALLAFPLAACDQNPKKAELPPAHEVTPDAVGHFCGMMVSEHPGPKAQILLKSSEKPVWFTSARDAFAFTMLPGEAKDISAIYFSDMARAKSWDDPGPGAWVEAKNAFFVIGSTQKGGMGGEETVPFSDQASAQKFAAENGGKVTRFDGVPSAYIFNAAAEAPAEIKPGAPPAHPSGHMH